MKINKLLFFLLAVFSLNSCVEYVDNGTKPDGPEKPEEQKYTAEQANPTVAKYVGDTFEFKAMLNGVDVTSTSKFKVNGTAISGKTYVPHKTGSHSVIATMDNFEATFKFTVLEDEEPQPTGNRIEYDGDVYPLSKTQWILLYENSDDILQTTIGGVPHTGWVMASMDGAAMNSSDNLYFTMVFVPAVKGSDGKYYIAFPNEVSGAALVHVQGQILVNGTIDFETTSASYVFAGTGNTQPDLTKAGPYVGTANYTGTASGANSGETADLFWNGNYDFSQMIMPSAKGKGISINSIKNNKTISLNANKTKSIVLKTNK